MSFYHPLRQSQTVDNSKSTLEPARQPSNASTISSAYSNSSNPFAPSRTSTLSSAASSGYRNSTAGHKRGISEAIGMSPSAIADGYNSNEASSSSSYKNARQSLRSLPQATSPSPAVQRTGYGSTLDYMKSEDVSGRFQAHRESSPSPVAAMPDSRVKSMILSRADSITPGSSSSYRGKQYAAHHGSSPISAPDLHTMEKSSTKHLRTLSKFTQEGSADSFSINSPAQAVVGLSGRRRLQRTDPGSGEGNVALANGRGIGWTGGNWMDKQRQFLQAYEYLCHIGEAKEWIEDVIKQPIPAIVELEEALRDGVTLAETVHALDPNRPMRIFRNPRLQYRHSDNIAIFFQYLADVELPDLFRFELIDLYEKKNIPKVIYCIHALSWLLYRKGIVDFRIGNLIGQLEFEHHELEEMQKGLDRAGVSMPSFSGMGASFGAEPEPEPVETEEERMARELGENETTIVEFQSQMRGALIRLRLGTDMQGLWDNEDLLVELQSRIRGDWARQIASYRLEMRRFAVNLQSSCRGFLARSKQYNQEQWWKSQEGDIILLQNLVRAKKARDQVKKFKESLQREDTIQRLQAALRGSLLRRNIAEDRIVLERQSSTIEKLQSHLRGTLERRQQARLQGILMVNEEVWIDLQSAGRGYILRNQQKQLGLQLGSFRQSIAQIQAFARGCEVRREVIATKEALQTASSSIIQSQAALRGMQLRSRRASEAMALRAHSKQFVQLQAYCRGRSLRLEKDLLRTNLILNVSAIIALQGLSRAMLLRNDIGALLCEAEAEEYAIVELQAHALGMLVRRQFAEKQQFFKKNMEKVVKIQSFIRGRQQGEAYKSLTNGKNPPVGTIKGFVHLLNDSDFDFDEEVEFERLRKTVVQHVRQNEMAEQYIDQLDIKIALLVKNKITLDEVVKHQRHFGGHVGSLLTNTEMSSKDPFDLKALNKNSRKKLEHYQQLFFVLQTQPQYLARLFQKIRVQGTAENECKKIETLMMGLFGYAQKRREEYYLLKLMARSIKEEVDGCSSIQDYLRGNFFWSKLFTGYIRSPRDRKYMRDLLGPLVKENILENPELDLESDPMQIYRSSINNEELRTGRQSNRRHDIAREEAIKDPETRETFIHHLQDLRDIADQFLSSLAELMFKMPYGIRYLAQQTYQSLCSQFPHENPAHLLQIVGHWVWKGYLQPALVQPETWGVVDRALAPLQKRNLGEVSKVLGQVAVGRLFGGENVYLQPLNTYVTESIETLGRIWVDVITVQDAEAQFDIDEFNDLYARTKPTLYIKMADIFAIHHLVANDITTICPNQDDMLRDIVRELGSAKNNESEMMGVSSNEINLTLNPKLHDVEDPDAEVKALFMETKRCILYIIRIQSGPNLMDILVKPISAEDEDRWSALLAEEFASGTHRRGAYSEVNTMVDITAMSYAELKRTALENIMNLEQFGRITRHNHYQDLLNEIAVDIRTKHRRRIQRQRELEGVKLTLGNLDEKALWLEQQLKSYNDYIEQAMVTLQNKKGKKRFLVPFTKQYNHERELQRSGRVPKFGSYKYSARTLAEKGVLVSYEGYSERQYDKINLTLSSDEVGVFFIEGSMGSIQMPGASAQVPLDDLLQAQFNNHQFMNLFEGKMRLNVNLFLHLLFRKFYRDE